MRVRVRVRVRMRVRMRIKIRGSNTRAQLWGAQLSAGSTVGSSGVAAPGDKTVVDYAIPTQAPSKSRSKYLCITCAQNV